MTPHYNRLDETVLLMGRNIYFEGVIWKIIPELSLFTPSYLEHCCRHKNSVEGSDLPASILSQKRAKPENLTKVYATKFQEK